MRKYKNYLLDYQRKNGVLVGRIINAPSVGDIQAVSEEQLQHYFEIKVDSIHDKHIQKIKNTVHKAEVQHYFPVLRQFGITQREQGFLKYKLNENVIEKKDVEVAYNYYLLGAAILGINKPCNLDVNNQGYYYPAIFSAAISLYQQSPEGMKPEDVFSLSPPIDNEPEYHSPCIIL